MVSFQSTWLYVTYVAQSGFSNIGAPYACFYFYMCIYMGVGKAQKNLENF